MQEAPQVCHLRSSGDQSAGPADQTRWHRKKFCMSTLGSKKFPFWTQLCFETHKPIQTPNFLCSFWASINIIQAFESEISTGNVAIESLDLQIKETEDRALLCPPFTIRFPCAQKPTRSSENEMWTGAVSTRAKEPVAFTNQNKANRNRSLEQGKSNSKTFLSYFIRNCSVWILSGSDQVIWWGRQFCSRGNRSDLSQMHLVAGHPETQSQFVFFLHTCLCSSCLSLSSLHCLIVVSPQFDPRKYFLERSTNTKQKAK